MAPELSIIIVSYNTRELLRQCLSSFYAQAVERGWETFVVDNQSKDGSLAMVEEYFPQVKTIANQDNRGFAAANNQALTIARGKYLLLLNSDTIVLEDALVKLITFMESNPACGVAGPRLLNEDGSLQPSCRAFPSLLNHFSEESFLYKIFPRSRTWGAFYESYFDHASVHETDFIKGAVLIVRTEAFQAVGLMDDRFFMYSEETDWCYRFKQKGWKVIFTPEARIVHLGGQSTKTQSAKMFKIQNESHLKYFQKHFGLDKARKLKRILLFGKILRWGIFTVLAGLTKETKWQERRELYRETYLWLRSVSLPVTTGGKDN